MANGSPIISLVLVSLMDTRIMFLAYVADSSGEHGHPII